MNGQIDVDGVGHALDDQLCFALYATSRAMTAQYRPLLEPLGLTYPQYLVMLVLWEHGTVSVRVLGEHLHLDSGTLSPMLQRLEATGVVRRTRSTIDERSVDISLTEKGEELRLQAEDVPRHVGAACGLPVADIRGLGQTLRYLEAQLTGRGGVERPAMLGDAAADDRG